MAINVSDFLGISRSGLSAISSGGCYTMETNETGSGFGCGSTSIKVREELTIREELQKETDEWLGDMI